jgi:hypothetical protein
MQFSVSCSGFYVLPLYFLLTGAINYSVRVPSRCQAINRPHVNTPFPLDLCLYGSDTFSSYADYWAYHIRALD